MAVVLPVRSCSAQKVDNWRTQLESDYRGAIEFVFVVETPHDSAACALAAAPPPRPAPALRAPPGCRPPRWQRC